MQTAANVYAMRWRLEALPADFELESTPNSSLRSLCRRLLSWCEALLILLGGALLGIATPFRHHVRDLHQKIYLSYYLFILKTIILRLFYNNYVLCIFCKHFTKYTCTMYGFGNPIPRCILGIGILDFGVPTEKPHGP